MADLLKMSADLIDGRVDMREAGPINRINHQLSELSSEVAVVEAFSHSIVFKTDDGLVTFDTSNEHGGQSAFTRFSHGRRTALIRWSLLTDTSIMSVVVGLFVRPTRVANQRSLGTKMSPRALIGIE